MLFPRRQAVAMYASALLAAGEPAEALRWARRSRELPAEDVRSRVVAARVMAQALAANGRLEEARVVADEAVEWATRPSRSVNGRPLTRCEPLWADRTAGLGGTSRPGARLRSTSERNRF